MDCSDRPTPRYRGSRPCWPKTDETEPSTNHARRYTRASWCTRSTSGQRRQRGRSACSTSKAQAHVGADFVFETLTIRMRRIFDVILRESIERAHLRAQADARAQPSRQQRGHAVRQIAVPLHRKRQIEVAL